MFSHALVAYQVALMEFFTKTTETFYTTIAALEKEPHYSFTILKELTQSDGQPVQSTDTVSNTKAEPTLGENTVDSDQLLFFNVRIFNIISSYLLDLICFPF